MKDLNAIETQNTLIPAFSIQEKQEMLDYITVYEKYEKEIYEKAKTDLKNHPVFGKIINNFFYDFSKEGNHSSIMYRKDAIENDNWQPYIESKIEHNISYAKIGFGIKSWQDTISVVKDYIIPYLHKENDGCSEKLFSSLNGMNLFMDIEMNIIADGFHRQKKEIIRAESIKVKCDKSKTDQKCTHIAKTENINNDQLQFVYIASHDLQEPLRTISNYVNFLKVQYKGRLDKNADECIDFITGATLRMQALIRDLLEYSKIGSDKKMTEVNCNNILQDVKNDLVAAILESNADIKSDKLPVIKGYYSEIKSLFQNLISNAIKFRKKDTPLNINITVKDNGQKWLFAIQDNGIGIEKQYFKRIFVIFQKLHSSRFYTGTGIGLAYCKKTIELHGGKIWIDSAPDIGSIFYFTIPKKIRK